LGFKDLSLGSKWKISQAIFGPDKTCLLAGRHFSEATLWNAETGALIARLQLTATAGEVINSVFADASPDGQEYLTVSDSGIGAIWNRKSRTEHIKFAVPVRSPINRTFFSLDGNHFFVGTLSGQLCRCNAKTGALEPCFGEPCKDLATILASAYKLAYNEAKFLKIYNQSSL
jgi:WD40 repeat protein